MNFVEKARQKYDAYSAVGFECSPIIDEESQSSFISKKDGVTRKHTFSHSTINVEIISEEEIQKIDTIPIVEKAEDNVVEPIPVEVPKTKKTTTKKKKGG